jgi:hypothetical protein
VAERDRRLVAARVRHPLLVLAEIVDTVLDDPYGAG